MKTIFFDTHTHYNHPDFDADLSEVKGRIRKAGVKYDAVIGYDPDSSRKAIELAAEDGSHFAVAGIHPLHAEPDIEEAMRKLESLASGNVAAIGETGLDYFKDRPRQVPDKALQRELFRAQLRLSKKLELPVVIHSRDAAQDTAEILKDEGTGGPGGVIHCFSYSPEMAEIFTRMGFYLGIGGKVTYPASKRLRETVRRIPLEMLVLETDAPYLSPEGRRGERNDSLSLPLIAEAVAEIKDISPEEVARVTTENAFRLYRIHNYSHTPESRERI